MVKNRDFFHTPPAFDAPVMGEGSSRNIAITFVTEKSNIIVVYQTAKKVRIINVYSFRHTTQHPAGQADAARRHRPRLYVLAACIARQKLSTGILHLTRNIDMRILSVRRSVRPSRSGIVAKRLDISSHYLQHIVA